MKIVQKIYTKKIYIYIFFGRLYFDKKKYIVKQINDFTLENYKIHYRKGNIHIQHKKIVTKFTTDAESGKDNT